MPTLIAGVALWWGAHLFGRLAPGPRTRMGGAGKGAVALALVVAIVLMVRGYGRADYVPLWVAPAWAWHANNAAMLVAVYLFGVGGTKGVLYTRMRHPMLWGTVIWSVAHIAVNGHLAALVLFGGIGLWALVAMAAINRAGPWVRPVAGRGWKGDAMNLAGTAILYALIAAVHVWLGYNPFAGG